MIDVLPPLRKYKYGTRRILRWSATLTILCTCGAVYKMSTSIFGAIAGGGRQYLSSVYRLHRIILASIISLANLSASVCFCLVFAGRCMTGFDLLANYHSDLESLIRKSRSRFSSPGSSGSHVQDIVDKFQWSPPQQEPTQMAGRKYINDFFLYLVAKSELDRRWTLKMAVLNSNQLSSICCSKARSTARPRRMPMLISNISWRFATHSPSEELVCLRLFPFSLLEKAR
jgi:hypothetical protein